MLQVETTSGRWEALVEAVQGFVEADRFDAYVDGHVMQGLRSPDAPSLWLRDYSDMLRVARYFLDDVQSVVDGFTLTQAATGRVFDYVTTVPEKPPGERENWEKWVRVPVEADVEYRFVKAAFLAWQATGDGAWIERLLPSLDRALRYTMTHPWRWDDVHGLVKRAYTIDTWDFDYTAGRADWLNFQITGDTFWGIFHGDNSGFFEACRMLERLYTEVADPERAAYWDHVAQGVRRRANDLLFNGRFYTHLFKLSDVVIDGVDEAAQLSLSNPMAVNRGMATHEMAVALLLEYQHRRAHTGAFAEWFSIDPPFPDGIFGDEKLRAGAYVNGGIFPLAGGELALAAFAHGFEQYGLEILSQYMELVASSGASYLWYFPDGTPASLDTSTSPDAQPTDGWGSTAMLHAFVEGLCGVRDVRHGFRSVELSPRWAATEERDVRVQVDYPASGASFGYRYRRRKRALRITMEAPHASVRLHVMVPPGATVDDVLQDDEPVPFTVTSVERTPYVDATVVVKDRSEVMLKLI